MNCASFPKSAVLPTSEIRLPLRFATAIVCFRISTESSLMRHWMALLIEKNIANLLATVGVQPVDRGPNVAQELKFCGPRSKNLNFIKRKIVCCLLTGMTKPAGAARLDGLQPSLKNLRQKIPLNGETRLKFGFSYENFTTQSFSVLPTPFWLNVS